MEERSVLGRAKGSCSLTDRVSESIPRTHASFISNVTGYMGGEQF